MPDQPVVIKSNSPAKILVSQKAALLTAFWPPDINVYPTLRTQSIITILCAIKIFFQDQSIYALCNDMFLDMHWKKQAVKTENFTLNVLTSLVDMIGASAVLQHQVVGLPFFHLIIWDQNVAVP